MRRCDHITPTLRQLHWLLVRQRVLFKLAVLVFRCLTDQALLYLAACTWQFIIFTFSTITACIISYSFRISFRTQDLALQQILFSIDLFLFYRTDYTDSRTMLNGCTGKCVRLSRPLVGFWTHFKSPHFHSFIHSKLVCFTLTYMQHTRRGGMWYIAL